MRAAIAETNALPGRDSIVFNIPPPGAPVIGVVPPQVSITDELVIDGTSQPDWDLVTVQRGVDTLNPWEAFSILASRCEIKGLAIQQFIGEGIILVDVDSTRIQGCVFQDNLYGSIAIHRSNDNLIGGTLPSEANTFLNNNYPSIVVYSGMRNTIRRNSISANRQPAIDLRPGVGVTLNDSLDLDSGANALTNYPIIDSFTITTAETQVFGEMQGQRNHTYLIDLYTIPECNLSGHGDGQVWVHTTTATTDSSGRGDFISMLTQPISAGHMLTATATDSEGNTSEFSPCSAPATLAATEPDPLLPRAFALFPNFPNPFNASTSIRFSLARPAHVTLTIHNILGQEVRVLVDERMPAGEHSILWDGRDEMGRPASSGVYFNRIVAGEETQVRKMVLLK